MKMANVRVYIRKTHMFGGKREYLADPYTVVIGTSIYGMGENPNHPQGFNQYSGEVGAGWSRTQHERQFGKRVPWKEVPPAVKKAIQEKM